MRSLSYTDPFGLSACDPPRVPCSAGEALKLLGRNFLSGLGAMPGDQDEGPGWRTGAMVGQALLLTGMRAGAISAGSRAAPRTVTLYRAVGQAELDQLAGTGVFQQGAGSLGGKWFWESAESAARFGEWTGEAFHVIETTIPRSTYNTLLRRSNLDQLGPAVYAELDQLAGAIVRFQ